MNEPKKLRSHFWPFLLSGMLLNLVRPEQSKEGGFLLFAGLVLLWLSRRVNLIKQANGKETSSFVSWVVWLSLFFSVFGKEAAMWGIAIIMITLFILVCVLNADPQQLQPDPPFLPRGSGELGNAGFALWDEANQHELFIPSADEKSHEKWERAIYLQPFIQAFSPDGYYKKEHPYQQVTGWHLSYQGEKHLITVAPSGAGKGTCAVIPTLLFNKESTFVLDVKGEIYEATENYRKRAFGHRIIKINPFDMLGAGSHRFNPLAFLDPQKEDDCTLAIQAIAQALVPQDKDKPFFSTRARSLIMAVLGMIVWEESQKGNTATLPMLSSVLHQNSLDLAAWLLKASEICPLIVVKENAGAFIGSSDMIESVKATAQQNLDFLKLKSMVDFFSGHDFDFRDLRNQPATIYFMIPYKMLAQIPIFLRLMVQVAFEDLEQIEDKNKNRVLLVLDEVAQLGYMDKIYNSFSMMRGFNVRVWAFFQNLKQMEEVYGKGWESMISSAAIVQFFTPNDAFTVEWLSKRIGDSTVAVKSSSSGNTGSGANSSISYNLKNQRFMSWQDLYGLPKDRALLFVQGLQYPVLAERIPFFDDRSPFKNRH